MHGLQNYADRLPTTSLSMPGTYDVDGSLSLSAAIPRGLGAGRERSERTPSRGPATSSAAMPFTGSLASLHNFGSLDRDVGIFPGAKSFGGLEIPRTGNSAYALRFADVPRSGVLSPRRHAPDLSGAGLSGSMGFGATFGGAASDRANIPSLDGPAFASEGARTLEASALGAVASSAPVLQRRLATETRNREACQLALTKTLRSIGIFRHQLQSVSNEFSAGDSGAQRRLRELAEVLEVEISDAAALVGVGAGMAMEGLSQSSLVLGGISPGNHDVLRQSLVETQRRCEGLNVEMLRQMEINEEAVASLNIAKDANRRLTDQIRQQADEIASFAKRHVADEHHFDELRKTHVVEEDLREKDLQRHIVTLQEAAETRYQKMHSSLTDKLRLVRGKLEHFRRDTARLRDDHYDQRRSAAALIDSMRQSFFDMERSFIKHLDEHVRKHSTSTASKDTAIRDFESRLAAERDLRMSEVSSWSNRHMTLSTERDDLHARLTHDVAQLTGRLQTSEQSLHMERQNADDGRARLHHECEELQLHRRSCENVIEQHRQSIGRLESSTAVLDQNHQTSQQTVAELRRQLRESDDALSLAVGGNEELRGQMEDQRQRLCDSEQLALAQLKEAADERLLHVEGLSKVEIVRTTGLWRETEDQARAREVEIGFLRAQEASVSEDATAMRRDLEQSKVQSQTATNMKEVLETDLTDVRKEFADVRGRLQGSVDRLELQKSTLEAEVQSTNDRLREVHRACGDRDADHGRHADALELGIRDRDARLEDKERKLVEVREQVAVAEAESVAQICRVQELQASLEALGHSSAEDRRRFEEERRRLDADVANSGRLAQDGQSQYEQWRDAHMVSLRQLQDTSQAKHGTTEKERDSCREELAEASRELFDMRARVESNEQEVLRVRYLLNESQSNVNFVKQEREREEHNYSEKSGHLREEAMQMSGALEAAMRNEVALAQQLEAATTRYQQECLKAQMELEEIKDAENKQAVEAERRVERLRAEYEGQLQGLDSRHRDELLRERKAADTLSKENNQLRCFLKEHRRISSADINSLHSQLEGHIGRLQRHTEELRGDLNRSAAVGLQPPQLPLSHVYDSSRANLALTSSPRIQVAPGGLPRTLAPAFEGPAFRNVGDGGG